MARPKSNPAPHRRSGNRWAVGNAGLGVLVLIAATFAFAAPARASNIPIDVGDVGDVFTSRAYAFSDLNGQALDGSTHTLDFVFADMEHLEANVPADAVMEIGVRLNHSGGFISLVPGPVDGFLSDAFGNNILDTSATSIGTANGAISYGLTFEGGLDGVVFHDFHLTFTLPTVSGAITGAQLEVLTTCDGCDSVGDLTVGAWTAPTPTTLSLLGLGLAVFGVRRRTRR